MAVLMLQEIHEESDILRKCPEKNREMLQAIAGEYKSRGIRFVVCAGRGTSDHAGVYAKYLFESRLKTPVSLAAPSINTMLKARLATGPDVLYLGISQSGFAEDVINVLQDAGESGAMTVSITNNPGSTLAETSQWPLYCHAGPEKSVAATKTFSATLQVVAGLVAAIADDGALAEDIASAGAWVEEAYRLEPIIDDLAGRFRAMEECTVLSRGFTYPIALEMALKLKECAYVKADALAISDFMHGPIAAIDPREICFLIADKGPFLEQYLELYAKLKDYGAKVLLITNDDAVARINPLHLLLPDCGNPVIAPLLYATAIQLFACKFAVQKGLNPDTPRNLKKITITR